MSFAKAILDALEKKYDAEIAHGDATIKIYLTNSVGIGEHGDVIDEIDVRLEQMASAHDKLDMLNRYFTNNSQENQNKE